MSTQYYLACSTCHKRAHIMERSMDSYMTFASHELTHFTRIHAEQECDGLLELRSEYDIATRRPYRQYKFTKST